MEHVEIAAREGGGFFCGGRGGEITDSLDYIQYTQDTCMTL